MPRLLIIRIPEHTEKGSVATIFPRLRSRMEGGLSESEVCSFIHLATTPSKNITKVKLWIVLW